MTTTTVNFLIPVHHYWVDRLNPWLVHFGNGFGVRWYGLAYLAGFLLAGWILAPWARGGKLPIPETEVASFILYAALGVMIGGRLGYCLLYNLHEVIHRPLEIVEVWHGGMASHGGIAGLIVAIWLFARRRGLNTLSLLDAAAATVLTIYGAGRFVDEFWRQPDLGQPVYWGRMSKGQLLTIQVIVAGLSWLLWFRLHAVSVRKETAAAGRN